MLNKNFYKSGFSFNTLFDIDVPNGYNASNERNELIMRFNITIEGVVNGFINNLIGGIADPCASSYVRIIEKDKYKDLIENYKNNQYISIEFDTLKYEDCFSLDFRFILSENIHIQSVIKFNKEFDISLLSNDLLIMILDNRISTQYMSSSKEKYHTIYHIRDMISMLEKSGILYENSTIYDQDTAKKILFAVYYHDSTYIPGNLNNEEQSCNNFKKDFPFVYCKYPEIVDIIMATKVVEKPKYNTFCEQLIHDLDFYGFSELNLLNKSSSLVRNEYPEIDDETYLKGRINFLKSINNLYPNGIFQSSLFKYRNEVARANIERHIEYLEEKLNEDRDN